MADITDRTERMLVTDCGRAISELAAEMNADDLARLVEVISDPGETPDRIGRAALILGRTGHKKALDPILSVLDRLDGQSRLQAADALGRIGGAKARDALGKLSEDQDANVRKFAALGLARVGDTKAQSLLKKIAERDSAAFVRETASRHVAKGR